MSIWTVPLVEKFAEVTSSYMFFLVTLYMVFNILQDYYFCKFGVMGPV